MDFESDELYFSVSVKELIAVPKRESKEFTKVTSQEINIGIGTNVKMLRGNTLTIKCPLNVKGKVKVTWLRDQQKLHPSQHHRIKGDTIIIKDSYQVGIFYFTCVAKTNLGTAQLTSKVEIISKFYPLLLSLSLF